MEGGKMTKAEQEFLIMCAVDYTIKRHTSAPNEMVRIISNYWEEYSNSLQVQKNWIESRGAVIEYYFAKFIFKQKVIWL